MKYAGMIGLLRLAREVQGYSVILRTLGTVWVCASCCVAGEPIAPRAEAQGHKVARVVAGSTVDVGTVDPSCGTVSVKYRWRNQGTGTLSVDKIISGCTCVSVRQLVGRALPGEHLEFLANVDALGIHGNGAGMFMVTFKEKDAKSQDFLVEFFRPQEPTASPAKLDLGTSVPVQGATRELVVSCVGDIDTCHLDLQGQALSDNTVSCNLVDRSQKRFQAANASRESVKHILRFRVHVAKGVHGRTVSGAISLPLRYNGETVDVTVPYTGRFVDRTHVRPDRVVLIGSSAQPRMTSDVLLFRNEGVPAPSSTECTCNDPRLTALFVADSSGGHEGVVGRIRISTTSDALESFDTEVVVRTAFGEAVSTIHVPVKVRAIAPE